MVVGGGEGWRTAHRGHGEDQVFSIFFNLCLYGQSLRKVKFLRPVGKSGEKKPYPWWKRIMLRTFKQTEHIQVDETWWDALAKYGWDDWCHFEVILDNLWKLMLAGRDAWGLAMRRMWKTTGFPASSPSLWRWWRKPFWNFFPNIEVKKVADISQHVSEKQKTYLANIIAFCDENN